MALGMKIGPRDGHAQFERHIESWHGGRRNAHFNTGEIVDGISAALDELEDSVESAFSARDFGCNMGNQIQLE
jgi:hypothetical protein